MMSLVKLDEDLAPLVAAPLLERGHDVRSVAAQGWSGSSDAELWPRILSEGAMLITADKGFADVRAFPPGTHHGIVLLRPETESLHAYRDLLQRLLQSHDLDALQGAVIVVTPRGVRVRRPR